MGCRRSHGKHFPSAGDSTDKIQVVIANLAASCRGARIPENVLNSQIQGARPLQSVDVSKNSALGGLRQWHPQLQVEKKIIHSQT